jgi:putative transposase
VRGRPIRLANTTSRKNWKAKYGGMDVSDAKRPSGRSLEEVNRKLKKLLAESMLDVATLREALGKNF